MRALAIAALALLLALAFFAGFAVGITFAASRPSPDSSASLPDVQARTGAPHERTSQDSGRTPGGYHLRPRDDGGAPSPTAVEQSSPPRNARSATERGFTGETPATGNEVASMSGQPFDAWMRDGILAWADESHGPGYLAVPWGRGVLVTVCGPGGCVTLPSTDAGPDLAMQRAGRIGDLAVGLWETVCGVDRTMGLCPATVQIAGRP